jgi:hypothetical protein
MVMALGCKAECSGMFAIISSFTCETLLYLALDYCGIYDFTNLFTSPAAVISSGYIHRDGQPIQVAGRPVNLTVGTASSLAYVPRLDETLPQHGYPVE